MQHLFQMRQMLHLIQNTITRCKGQVLKVKKKQKGGFCLMKTRRNVTNEFLKECLADSLLQLLETKKIEEITITEITERANVGRATYYRNFHSKEAVIVFKLRYVMEQWAQQLDNRFPETGPSYESSLEFMRFFYMNRPLFISLYEKDLLNLLIQALYEFAEQAKPATEEELNPFVQAFHTFGIFGVIYEWVRNGMSESPESVTDIMFNQMFEERMRRAAQYQANLKV